MTVANERKKGKKFTSMIHIAAMGCDERDRERERVKKGGEKKSG